jgi:hypothetical protein
MSVPCQHQDRFWFYVASSERGHGRWCSSLCVGVATIGLTWRINCPYIVLVSDSPPSVVSVAQPVFHEVVKERAGDPANHTGPFLLRCSCGRSIAARIPLAQGARYTCSSCSSSGKEKTRLKRIRNEARNTALRQRLDPFLTLALDGHEREWFELAQELKVDAVALETLVAIVQERKWQQSAAPLMFVRLNVERRSEEWKDPFSEDGRLYRAQIFSPVPTREERAWLKQRDRIIERNALVTPKDIEAANQTLSIVQDAEERGVICARALGLTRAQYLSGVSDPERRRRAAAWKRLYRHGIPSELRKALRARAWQDLNDYETLDYLPSKATPVPRYDFQEEDWRSRRVIQYARR